MLRISHYLPPFVRLPEDPINSAKNGLVQAALSFALESVKKKHKVHLIGWKEGRSDAYEYMDGLRISTHPGYEFGGFLKSDARWLIPVLLRSYIDRVPDILHVHSDLNLLRSKGKAKILHMHTPAREENSATYLKLLNRCDVVVCCSNFLRDSFLAGTGWDANRTLVVHNGADEKRFYPANAAQKKDAREKLGVHEDDFVFLFVGAIVPVKGLLHLLKAFGKLRVKNRRCVLLVAGSLNLWGGLGGSPEHQKKYQNEVNKNIPEGTIMLGKQDYDRMPEIYRAADVMMMPSIWKEPFALAVLEGLASGLPLVASDIGGIPEAVGDAGILVPPGDETTLEKAMETLTAEPGLVTELRAKARRRAANFTWQKAGEAMESIYRKLT